MKTAYHDNAERLERGGVNTIGKQHFTSLYSPARETAFTKRNILAGWSKGGLFPFNPQRVLRDLETPYAKLKEAAADPTAPEAGVVAAPPPPAASVTLVAPVTPVIPVTPVSAEAFTFLQNTIVRHDARKLDEVDKQRLMRHIEKLAKAGKVLLARSALQEGHIRFLHKINNEGEARRSTRAIVLGTAKVMSYEDLEEAKAKRAEQREKGSRKGKRAARGKRNKKLPQACDASVEYRVRQDGEAPDANDDDGNHSGDMHGAIGGSLAPCPGKAPVSKMW